MVPTSGGAALPEDTPRARVGRRATVHAVTGHHDAGAQPPDARHVDAGVALSILDAAPDAMLLIGPDGAIIIANQAACDLFGLPLDELVTRGVDDLLPESMRAAHAKHRTTYGNHPRRRAMGSGLELVGVRSDGMHIPVEISLSPLRIDGVPHVIAAVRDVTERRAAQHALAAAHSRLATTEERERIGRDLHDSVLQRLYGAGLILQASLGGDVDGLRRSAERASVEIDDTITEIRSVIFDLGRESTEVGSLEDRLATLVRDMAETYGFDADLDLSDDLGSVVSPSLVTTVVAVVREALSNAGRHAAASTVVVAVRADADRMLRLRVTDDGRGFDPDQIVLGSGLENFRHRAEEFAGTAVVHATPGVGTTLRWEIPLPDPLR